MYFLGMNTVLEPRRKTKKVKVGNIYVGGDAPIIVQSMTNTDTSDIKTTLKQIHALEEVGCEIIRVSVLNEKQANSLSAIEYKLIFYATSLF